MKRNLLVVLILAIIAGAAISWLKPIASISFGIAQLPDKKFFRCAEIQDLGRLLNVENGTFAGSIEVFTKRDKDNVVVSIYSRRGKVSLEIDDISRKSYSLNKIDLTKKGEELDVTRMSFMRNSITVLNRIDGGLNNALVTNKGSQFSLGLGSYRLAGGICDEDYKYLIAIKETLEKLPISIVVVDLINKNIACEVSLPKAMLSKDDLWFYINKDTQVSIVVAKDLQWSLVIDLKPL